MFCSNRFNSSLRDACHLVLFVCILNKTITCVIVDGDRKDELSPIKNQTRDEELAIDSYNTKTCGMSDPNSEEHEFINMAREGQFPWLVSFKIKIMSNASYKEQIKASAKPILVGTKKAAATKTTTTTTTAPRTDGSKHKRQTRAVAFSKRHMEDMHFCSGSFISDKWILSAAHCFAGTTIENYLKNDKLIAVAGSHKVSSRSSLNANLTIERIYIHSMFNNSLPIGFDIALVELRDSATGARQVKFSQKRQKNEFGEQKAPFMNSICLPLKNKQYKAGESARIAGWGLSRAKDIHTMPSKLLTTDLLIRDTQDDCLQHYNKALNSSKPMEQHDKHRDLMCASYHKTRDACQSDSGGPLMQYANRKAVAIGIVSYGIGCATKGVPGLYTRVAAYIDWIEEITLNGPKAKHGQFKLIEATRWQDKETKGDKDSKERDENRDGEKAKNDGHKEEKRKADEQDANAKKSKR